MRNLLLNWVPRFPTVDQKQQQLFDEIKTIFLSICHNGLNNNPLLHSRVKSVVSWASCIRRITSKAAKSATVWMEKCCRSYCGIYTEFGSSATLNTARQLIAQHYVALVVRLKNEIAKKRLCMERKSSFNKYNAPSYKSLAIMAKLHKLSFELFPHPPYSLDLGSSNYYLFTDLKKCSSGTNFSLNKKLIAKIVLQKRYRNVRATFDRLCQSWRKLRLWMKWFLPKNVFASRDWTHCSWCVMWKNNLHWNTKIS